jgi:ribosomal protein L29
MKTRDIKDLHTKTVDELKKMIVDARENLFQMKLDATQFKVKNTSSLTTNRHDIARMMSVLRGKENSSNG